MGGQQLPSPALTAMKTRKTRLPFPPLPSSATRALIALTLACALGGCGGQQMTATRSQTLWNGKIEVGMTRLEVEQQLGFPQKVERVGATEFFHYTPFWIVPSATVASRTPVAIRNGKVVGMGKAYYEETLASAGNTAKAN
jgi:hypothetical protein